MHVKYFLAEALHSFPLLMSFELCGPAKLDLQFLNDIRIFACH